MRRALLLPLAVLLALAGCGSSGHKSATNPSRANANAARLRSALPAGFQAGAEAPPASPAKLEISPAAGMHAAGMHLALAPSGGELRKALAVALGEPVPVIVRPIFLDRRSVRPRQQIAVAAAHLGTAPNHAALFVLQGPGYHAERLVAVANEVAAGYVTLPGHMAPGVWYILAEETSGIRSKASHSLGGTALVDIGELTVSG